MKYLFLCRFLGLFDMMDRASMDENRIVQCQNLGRPKLSGLTSLIASDGQEAKQPTYFFDARSRNVKLDSGQVIHVEIENT